MKKLLKQSDIKSKIDLDGSPHVRHGLNDEVVEEYIVNYGMLVKMPEPVLFEDKPGHYLIGDGWHRIAAMKAQTHGNTSWVFEIQKGDYDDCLIYALGANLRHGLRRSNEDKRASAMAALQRFHEKSDALVAGMAFVSPSLVKTIREEMEQGKQIPFSDTRKGKDGKVYKKVRSVLNGPERTSTDENPNESEESETGGSVPDGAAKSDRFKAPPVERDKTGYIIPEDVKPLWHRGDEAKALMDQLSQIKCTLERAFRNEDPLFIEVSNSIIADLKMIREAVSYALPYSVCPTCNGKNKEKCLLCRGRGLVSETRYHTVSDSLLKIREKVCKK